MLKNWQRQIIMKITYYIRKLYQGLDRKFVIIYKNNNNFNFHKLLQYHLAECKQNI